MITHVWIEEGCCSCGACPSTAPAVFAFDDVASAVVCGEARLDGSTGMNKDERSPLLAGIAVAESLRIREAAEGGPVEVIRYRELD